jgi:hypothetical protein
MRILEKVTLWRHVDQSLNLVDNGVMTNKGADMNKDLQMYGMSREEIKEQYINGLTARLTGLEMVVAGILSDAQELMSFGHAQATDQARKNLNIAKFILFEMLDARERA